MGIWAAVKYALNSTLGTSSFLSLDKMIQAHGTQTFTKDGTFTVPDGVHKILVTAFGAGGSGYDYDGGQGGDFVIKKAFMVTPNDSLSITVGKGELKKDGGATVIGNLITLEGGGRGGVKRNHKGALGGTTVNHVEAAAQNTVFANGGLRGATNTSSSGGPGGYGGGAGYGRGGNGAKGNTKYLKGLDGEDGGIGAGGGGGGYGDILGTPGIGGNGIVIIEW